MGDEFFELLFDFGLVRQDQRQIGKFGLEFVNLVLEEETIQIIDVLLEDQPPLEVLMVGFDNILAGPHLDFITVLLEDDFIELRPLVTGEAIEKPDQEREAGSVLRFDRDAGLPL
jgi:hypothetical protein